MKDTGFTYISVLILVVVTGIALTGASRYWSAAVKREKEAELLFRGDQIKRAIGSYYNSAPGAQKNTYPPSLKDLLKDKRYPAVKRHLRKLYKDPMTKDGEWHLVLDSKGAIKGVCSTGTKQPVKTGRFKKEYKNFEAAEKYSDWQFIYLTKKGKKQN